MTTALATAPQAVAAAPKKAGLYRVLIGVHIGDGPEGCTCPGCVGPANATSKNHRYMAYKDYANLTRIEKGQEPLPPSAYTNDLIRSEVDLCALHNFGPHSRKFARVGEAAPAVPPEPAALPVVTGKDLDRMDARELRTLAKLLGVKAEDGLTKEELLSLLTGRPRE